jgi:hypothetical protein
MGISCQQQTEVESMRFELGADGIVVALMTDGDERACKPRQDRQSCSWNFPPPYYRSRLTRLR